MTRVWPIDTMPKKRMYSSETQPVPMMPTPSFSFVSGLEMRADEQDGGDNGEGQACLLQGVSPEEPIQRAVSHSLQISRLVAVERQQVAWVGVIE